MMSLVVFGILLTYLIPVGIISCGCFVWAVIYSVETTQGAWDKTKFLVQVPLAGLVIGLSWPLLLINYFCLPQCTPVLTNYLIK